MSLKAKNPASNAAVISRMIKNVKEKEPKKGVDLAGLAEELTARRAKNMEK